MVFSKALALAAIFATLTSAVPMQQKRDLVYQTVTETDITVVDTTITLYPGEATPTLSPAVEEATATPAVETSGFAEKQVASSSSTTYSPPAPAPQTSYSSSTTSAVAPTTYSPPAAEPTTSSSSSSTSSTSTSSTAPSTSTSGSILSGYGDGTYYDTATSSTSPSFCDTTNDGTSSNVVALSQDVMTEALCGSTIYVTYESKTLKGTVWDKCMGCDSQSIDMSRAMFGNLTDMSAGRITVSWYVV